MENEIREIAAADLVAQISNLKSSGFEQLANLTAVDRLTDGKIDMVYHLFAPTLHKMLTIKVPLDRTDPVIASLSGLWQGADWLEREVFDLFGVVFTDHPDLRRIMMWDGYDGYPLRKDFTSPEIVKLPEVK